MGCIFCKIIKNEIPSNKIYEDDKVLSIYDLNPIAPFHALIFPKEHIESANQINDSNSEIVGYIFKVAAHIAKKHNLNDGYRIINNCGENGGQTVKHIHFHLLGGKKLSWDDL